VRWGVAWKIVLAWVFTLPACIAFAYAIQRFLFSKLF
jgi:phosphate/sulfate permease